MATNLHIYYEKSIKRCSDRIIKILANVSEGKSKVHFTHIDQEHADVEKTPHLYAP
jgi:hypothetical protein